LRRTEGQIAAALARHLAAAGLTVAAAESLTGGRVAAALTRRPGSSAYFLGSVVAYANEAKVKLLDVPEAVLREHGAVSEACARAMALGARRCLGADLAVAATGIAGPDGGSPAKPVGLVWLAVAGDEGLLTAEHRFAGDRRAVTRAAVTEALGLLARAAGLVQH